MRYILMLLLLISTLTLFAQAMPKSILIKIKTADGSAISPSDISIRAYFQERPEELHTNITRPKHFKALQVDTIHKGFYIMLNPAAFASNWEMGETLVADITQISTGATIHLLFPIPAGTNVFWQEDPLTLTHSVPNNAINPNPTDKAANVAISLANIGWSFSSLPGYPSPVAYRFVIDTDSLFTKATVLYIKNSKSVNFKQNLPEKLLPLQRNMTYYWKIIPTTSKDPAIQPSSLRPIVINGKPLNSQASGDAVKVPVWRFTTEK